MRAFKRRLTTGFLVLGLGFVILHFQNCAMPSELDQYGPMSSDEVRIVDDWASEKITLFEKFKQVEALQDHLIVEGFCARSLRGEALLWELGSSIQGEVLCEMGGFRLVLEDLSALACNEAQSLSVYTADGSEEQILDLYRACHSAVN